MNYVCNCDLKQQVKIIVPEGVTDGFWHHEDFLLSCKPIRGETYNENLIKTKSDIFDDLWAAAEYARKNWPAYKMINGGNLRSAIG